jgi:hypothetical protein
MPNLREAVRILENISTYKIEQITEAESQASKGEFGLASGVLARALEHVKTEINRAEKLKNKTYHKKTDYLYREYIRLQPQAEAMATEIDSRKKEYDSHKKTIPEAQASEVPSSERIPFSPVGTRVPSSIPSHLLAAQAAAIPAMPTPAPLLPMTARNAAPPPSISVPKAPTMGAAPTSHMPSEAIIRATPAHGHHAPPPSPPSFESPISGAGAMPVPPREMTFFGSPHTVYPEQAAPALPTLHIVAPPPILPEVTTPQVPTEEHNYQRALAKLTKLGEQKTGVNALLEAFITEVQLLKLQKRETTPELTAALDMTYRRLTGTFRPHLYHEHAKTMQGKTKPAMNYLGALMLALSVAVIALNIVFFPVLAPVAIGALAVTTTALASGGCAFFACNKPNGLSKTMLDLDNEATSKNVMYTPLTSTAV